YFRYISVSETNVTNILRNDTKEYFSYAYNLRHNNIYSKDTGFIKNDKKPVIPDAIRNPGYPIFLSLFIDGKPSWEIINRILYTQLILSVLTLALLMFLYQKYLPLSFAAIALSMIAICPHLIVANSYILTETLFCFLIVFMGLMISVFIEKPTILRIFLAGLIMGLSNLVRPSILYFILFMMIFLVFHYKKKEGAKYSIALLLGFLLIFSPWIIRNYKTLGIMTDKSLMINYLHHGMYPGFKFKGMDKSYGNPYKFDPNSKKISKDVQSVLKEIKERFRKESEKHAIWYFLQKPLAFWAWNNVQGRYVFVYPVSSSPYLYRILFKMTYLFMKKIHWIVILFGFFGMFVVWLPRNKINIQNHSMLIARFISLLLIYYTAIHMIGFPLPRYSIPLRPFMYGMAFFSIFIILEFAKMHLRKNSNGTEE
ncbi:MAG: glycosyltransferase family 39 protein, partial [Deltaproteobacteria bacterium]|nr:glycosyltransferase family 39 protein [Deltaproteobacteria bacterium]